MLRKVLQPRTICGVNGKIPCWSRLIEFKKFRDSLTHPRQEEDETELEEYKTTTARGISSVIEVMNYLCKGILKSPLEKSCWILKSYDDTARMRHRMVITFSSSGLLRFFQRRMVPLLISPVKDVGTPKWPLKVCLPTQF